MAKDSVNKHGFKIVNGEGLDGNDCIVNGIINAIDNGIEFDFKNNLNLPWVKSYVVGSRDNQEVNYKLDPPILKEFLVHKHNFLFVKSKSCSTVIKYMYVDGCYKFVENEEMQRFIYQYVPIRVEDSRKIEEVMKLIYLSNAIRHESELDPENLINFKNGILNIDTMEFSDHSPNHLITNQRACNWNPEFKPETSYFDDYLHHLCYGKEDRKEFLLQCMGLAISNIDCSRLKKSLIMFGDHDTGKSKVKELLIHIIGENNYAAEDMATIENDPFATFKIFGKRLIGTNDMSYITVKELRMFKLLIGGDTISANRKHKDGFDFVFKGFMWMCANELPKFGGDKGDGVYSRIITLECSNKVKKVDRDLLEHLKSEADYVAVKAINAVRKVINNGYNLDIPSDCLTANEQYRIDNDSSLSFIRDCLTKFNVTDLRPNNRYTTKQIYDTYVSYCKDNSKGHCESNKSFKKAIDKKNLGEIKRIQGIKYYKHITLNATAINEYTCDSIPDELIDCIGFTDDSSNESSYDNDEREGMKESDIDSDKVFQYFIGLDKTEKNKLCKRIGKYLSESSTATEQQTINMLNGEEYNYDRNIPNN